MRLAKQVGEDSNPCYSRKIGVLIVDPETNTIKGTGYNGPPSGTPHTDSYDYLYNFVWPQLTREEQIKLAAELDVKYDYPSEILHNTRLLFCTKYENCGQCPRKILGFKSGERTEICSCAHAERNAITNAATNLAGWMMFCWCTVPCLQCAAAIINARIKTVHCLDAPLYHPESKWLFDRAGVEVKIWPEEEILNG